MLCCFQATLGLKGVKEMKALLDILELDSSVYVRIQVKLYGLFVNSLKLLLFEYGHKAG